MIPNYSLFNINKLFFYKAYIIFRIESLELFSFF